MRNPKPPAFFALQLGPENEVGEPKQPKPLPPWEVAARPIEIDLLALAQRPRKGRA